jgi:hypothetical protein
MDLRLEEIAMKFFTRIVPFALPLVLFWSLPARAHDVEVGTSLICDTQAQVERYISLYDGDAESTANSVNVEEHNPTACAIVTMSYMRGRQLARATNKDASFQIVPILVLGLVTEDGVKSITPAPFFSAFTLDEVAI